MKAFVIAAGALLLASNTLAAQTTVTPTSLNGWTLFDDAGPGTDPATITNAKPFNGNGSLQYTVSASNQQPAARYLFAPVALQGLNSLSLGYSFLTPLGTVPAASPTIRFLLTGISNGNQPGGRTDGSLGWYLNGSSDSWDTRSFSLTSGNFFFRLGGVGQAANDCATTGSSFDDRRQTIALFEAACNGVGGKINLNTASIYGVQVDWGTFVAPAAATSYADMVNFTVGANQGNFNFETTSVVPEPSSVALLALGMAAVGFVARRRKQNS
ncbi:MAG: PEP-CTERM sorting domain-containing protein [Gemmatimonas sp.]